MTAQPNDRDWDRLDALVDEDPIALRDAAWRLTTALAAAEHRATRAERTSATGLAATHRAIAVQARADGDPGRAHLHDWAATQADLYTEEQTP